MARGTKVSVGLEVNVTGADDIDALARSTDAAAKAAGKPLDVKASVSGGDKVADLATDLEAMPSSTPAAVSASVAGGSDVTDLADDLKAMPASTSAAVDADVTGGSDVTDLAGDLKAVPSSTSTTLAASVTGGLDLDAMADDIAALPAKVSVTVAASVTGSSGVSDLATELEDVESAAGPDGAGGELAGMGSEITGTLGGQFSDGAGMVADFGEQFGNLKQKVSDAGGGMKAIGAAAAGIGGTLLAGFGIDLIMGYFNDIAAKAAETKAEIDELAQGIVDAGGVMDANLQKLEIGKIVDEQAFAELQAWGADYSDLLSAVRGDTEAYDRTLEKLGGPLGMNALKLQALAGEYGYVRDEAQSSADQLLDYYDKVGLQKRPTAAMITGLDKVEDSLKSVGVQAAATGRAHDALTKDTNAATKATKALDDQPLDDKESTLTADDKATPKVNAANQKDLNDKQNELKSVDRAGPKLTTYNAKPMSDKEGDLEANDYASARVTAFNNKPIDDKTATVWANTKPAELAIAALNLIDVTVDIIARLGAGLTGSTASAPPGGRRAGVSASSAPAVRASTAVAPAGAGVTVYVNGALDPAAVARQIRQVLTRAERRTGALRSPSLRAPI